jgi:hypothetical protein
MVEIRAENITLSVYVTYKKSRFFVPNPTAGDIFSHLILLKAKIMRKDQLGAISTGCISLKS